VRRFRSRLPAQSSPPSGISRLPLAADRSQLETVRPRSQSIPAAREQRRTVDQVRPLPEVSGRGGGTSRLVRADLLLIGDPVRTAARRSNRVAMRNAFQDRPEFGVSGPRF
jgi:hypothetical protein